MSMAPSTTGSARLSKLGRTAEAGDACQTALTLGPPPAKREFLIERLSGTGHWAPVPDRRRTPVRGRRVL